MQLSSIFNPLFDKLALMDNLTKKNNISNIIDNHNKCAIWGINDKLMGLIFKSNLSKIKNLYLIDISKIKREMNVSGKKIYSPDIIETLGIDIIIIGVPFLFSNISLQIKMNHKRVNKIIDVCQLFSDDCTL